MVDRVSLYDTTLRDGAQTEGVSFSNEDKLDVLSHLDAFDFATCACVEWCITRRLLEPLGDGHPAEYEERYHEQAKGAVIHATRSPMKPVRFTVV